MYLVLNFKKYRFAVNKVSPQFTQLSVSAGSEKLVGGSEFVLFCQGV